MSTRPSGRLISTTSAHDPSPSAPISTSLKTQATYPPSVRERARNTRPPSHPQSRDGPHDMTLVEDLATYLPRPGRSHPLDRYARTARFAPASDEAIVLEAMRHARFSSGVSSGGTKLRA